MHGPWIERSIGYAKEGRGSWECLAEISERSFHRDYLLDDILGGVRHGMQEIGRAHV